MIQPKFILEAFEKLSYEILLLSEPEKSEFVENLYSPVIFKASQENPWFTPEFTRHALVNLGQSLAGGNIKRWLAPYSDLNKKNTAKSIGVVLAGNIPLVGFSDLLCVLFSGNRFIGKLSSDDKTLTPFIVSRLTSWYPELSDSIRFTEDKLSDFDGVIATGSNNTARYFEYYFRKYPYIIRKNRNGVAVLTGDESKDELAKLAEDVFLYFGMGCRSVSKIYVPSGYDFKPLLDVFSKFAHVGNHTKYRNNYDFYRSIFLINKVRHYDSGFLLLTEESAIASPPSVLYYEEFKDLNVLTKNLDFRKEEIQCIVSSNSKIQGAVSFGSAQKPALWDYADGVDTMQFLLGLNS